MEVKHSTKACAEKTGRRGPEKLVISYLWMQRAYTGIHRHRDKEWRNGPLRASLPGSLV